MCKELLKSAAADLFPLALAVLGVMVHSAAERTPLLPHVLHVVKQMFEQHQTATTADETDAVNIFWRNTAHLTLGAHQELMVGSAQCAVCSVLCAVSL